MPSNATFADWPVALSKPGASPNNTLYQYGNPSFLLEKDGQYDYAVVNGFVYDLRQAGAVFELR
jgi:hypothetical protein